MYLTIDIGGTKTEVMLFSNLGCLKQKFRFFTNADPNKFTSDLTNRLQLFLTEDYDIKVVAVAFPGIVENNRPLIAPNLPSWQNFDLVALLKGLFKCPIFFANDADLAAIYETKGKPGRTIYLTFSTGLGGGIAENGRLTPESSSFEPGHDLYVFNGQESEWEDIASASAINAVYGGLITDPKEDYVFRDIALRVSLGITRIIQTLHPDTIIIGGPLGAVFPSFGSYLEEILRSTLGSHAKLPKIVKAKRPMDATSYGCRLFAQQNSR